MSNNNQISAIELFAGIGGFRIAAEEHGIKTIWANDIDKHAAQVYRDRFGEEFFYEGDIWKMIEETPSHQLLTGGFPCQPFSSAGKKKGVEDPRGTLFEAIIKILKKHQPEYFVLENVKRLLSMDNGRHFATIISSLAELDYKIEWRLLNAVDFGLPQNRQRIAITGVHKRNKNNSKVRLVSTAEFQSMKTSDVENIDNLDSWEKIVDRNRAFPVWGIADGDKYIGSDVKIFSEKTETKYLRHILEQNIGGVYDLTEATKVWIEKNTPVNKYVGGVEILSNQAGGARMGYTIFGANGVAPTLTSSTSRHYERYEIDGRYRRLTPNEYARIQGFPDNHCLAAPHRVQYVLYGNAVPPPLVSWVIKQLIQDSPLAISDLLVSEKLPFENNIYAR